MDSSLINLLVGTLTPTVVVALILGGWLVPKPFYDRLEEENAALKAGRDWERERADTITQSAAVTNQLIGALADVATQRRAQGPPPDSPDRTATTGSPA